jgi:uncharacterized protein (DUF58 family)
MGNQGGCGVLLLVGAAALGTTVSLGPALALAEHAQPQNGSLPRPALAAVVRGIIKLVNCDAVAADIRVASGGRSHVTLADRSEKHAFRFNIAGLRRGTHTVTPSLAAGRCPGGIWMPASQVIEVRGHREVIHVHFEYVRRGR